MKRVSLFLSLIIAAASGSLSAGEVLASSFGFDETDATECLQKAFDSGAETVRIDKQKSDWIIRPVFLRSNQTVIVDPGVTVRAKKNEFHKLWDSLFNIDNADNVVLKGGKGSRLLMNKRDYQDKSLYKHSEWRMLVSILGSSNVTVQDLILEGSGGDGVYVGLSGKRRTAPQNIVLKNLDVKDNHRQGISIISVKNLYVGNCRFYETSGTAPQAGIDFEPNNVNESLENCVVENCEIFSNRSYGILFHLHPLTALSAPISITIRNCRISGGDNGAVVIDSCSSMSQVKGKIAFENCTITGSDTGANALIIRNQRADGFALSFKDCRLDNSRSKGHPVKIISETTSDIDNVTFRNVSITDSKKVEWAKLESTGAKPMFGGDIKYNGSKIMLSDWSHAQKVVKAVLFTPAEFDPAKLTAPAGVASGKTAPGFRYRGAVTFLQYAAAGQQVKVTVHNLPLGTRKAPITLAITSPSGKIFKTMKLDPGATDISFTATETGIYRFFSRTSYAISFDSAMPGQGMLAKKLGMFATRKRDLYFETPADAKEVMLYVKGCDGEEISLRIYNGKNQLMGELDKVTLGTAFRHTKVFPGREIWRIEITFMREDSEIELGGDLNPVVSVTPELLLRSK